RRRRRRRGGLRHPALAQVASGRASRRAAVVGEWAGGAEVLAQRCKIVATGPLDGRIGVAEAVALALVLGAPGLVAEGYRRAVLGVDDQHFLVVLAGIGDAMRHLIVR